MSAWGKDPSTGAWLYGNEHGAFVVTRHGEGRKYWGVAYPDGTYTHTALTLEEAKRQAETWKRDPTLVQLDLGHAPLTHEVVNRVIASAEPMKPEQSYYSYTSVGADQQKALGALRELRALRDEVEAAIREQVEIARKDTHGGWSTNAATWDHVGKALGVTKQSAASRFGVKTA